MNYLNAKPLTQMFIGDDGAWVRLSLLRSLFPNVPKIVVAGDKGNDGILLTNGTMDKTLRFLEAMAAEVKDEADDEDEGEAKKNGNDGCGNELTVQQCIETYRNDFSQIQRHLSDNEDQTGTVHTFFAVHKEIDAENVSFCVVF